MIDGGAVYNSSGVTHIGFADVCDSLCAIKDVCFNENNTRMTLPPAELVRAVDQNFKGYEILGAYLKNKAPKYGTSHPVAVEMSQKLIDLGYEVFNNGKNYRGGNYWVAYWTTTNHAGYGSVTGAYALNMKYSPVACSLKNADRFGSIVQTYMETGGQQIQFNIQDYRTLKQAKADPSNHPHLLVRVSGYSAYFKSLIRKQLEYIRSQEKEDQRVEQLSLFK